MKPQLLLEIPSDFPLKFPSILDFGVSGLDFQEKLYQ
jgi:hypothetical protein